MKLLDFTLFFDEAFINRLKSYHIYDIEKVATGINFVVLIGFIVYFYKNLKNPLILFGKIASFDWFMIFIKQS